MSRYTALVLFPTTTDLTDQHKTLERFVQNFPELATGYRLISSEPLSSYFGRAFTYYLPSDGHPGLCSYRDPQEDFIPLTDLEFVKMIERHAFAAEVEFRV